MPWTRFMDMHSGGGAKEEWEYILIEAPEPEARVIFYNRFGHNPDRVTCTCCGNDYSVEESETLAEATAYDRNCAFDGDGYIEKTREGRFSTGKLITVDEYVKRDDVLVIPATDIKPEEREGDIPDQGYIWV